MISLGTDLIVLGVALIWLNAVSEFRVQDLGSRVRVSRKHVINRVESFRQFCCYVGSVLGWVGYRCNTAYFCVRFQGPGFRVQGSGFRVQGSGFRVQGSGFKIQGSEFRVQSSGSKVQGSGLRIHASGFRDYAVVQPHRERDAPAFRNVWIEDAF